MTRYEIKTEVLVRLGKDTTSAWTSEAFLNDWVNQAHKWAAGYHKWPMTEGKQSTTFASLVTDEQGYLRGEYPEGWKSDSIRQLTIDGKRLQKLNWEDFQIFVEEQTSDDRVYSDFARQYFINPNIDLSGTVTAWGQYSPADIPDGDGSTADDMNTVFVGESEADQAIVEMAMSYVLRRDGREKESIDRQQIAKGWLDELWKRITDEGYAYHSKNRGMFTRVDVVDGTYHDELNTDQFN